MAKQATFLLDEDDSANAADTGARVGVVIPRPINKVYDYAVAEGEAIPPIGAVIEVPLSGRLMPAVVWSHEGDGSVPYHKLKAIGEMLDVPILSEKTLKFVEWVAAYTLTPLGSVLKLVLSSYQILKPPPVRQHVVLSGDIPQRMSDKRRAVLDVVGTEPMTVAEAAEAAGVSDAVVRGLVNAGGLTALELATDKPFPEPDIARKGPTLTDEQAVAVKAITDSIWEQGFQPFLLDGVTGSGKTEVYFEAIIEALKEPSHQVLVLVPEIALTTQWLDRFEARFGVAPVVWHSDIGDAERRRAWRAVGAGQARVVVGARSALFLPFQNLSLIVVDEEHDTSFKQDEGVLYHARDMAVLRARIEEAAVVLASATPSLESLVNAREGRYQYLQLRERHGGAALPQINAIDMRSDGTASAAEWLSPDLITQIQKRLDDGEQSILFLNRRGYAPLTLCRNCGHRFECPHCSAWLVEHRHKPGLQCHHCGYEDRLPSECPECREEGTLAACGPGVERLEEEVKQRFPTARLAVMTSDTMLTPAHTAHMVDMIAGGAVDIIIGTQIVTKGYHFPNLTLVGVIDADLGLRGGDMRAAERTYQQMIQVAGRAGRADKPGTVYLQTYEPEHPVTHALMSGDGARLVENEIEARRLHKMPPFGRLVAVIVQGLEQRAVADTARQLGRQAPRLEDVHILGPAPAPLSRVRGAYRYRLLLHAPKDANVQKIMRAWVSAVKPNKGVKVKVDIDPQSFL